MAVEEVVNFMPGFTFIVTPHGFKFRDILSLHVEFVTFIERVVIYLFLGRFGVLGTLLMLYVFDSGIIWHFRLHERRLILNAHVASMRNFACRRMTGLPVQLKLLLVLMQDELFG